MAHRFLIAVSTLAFALPLAATQQGATAAPKVQTDLSFMEALELAVQSPAVRLAEGQLELARHQLSAASGVVSANFSADVSQAWQLGGESASDIGPLSAEATLNVVPYGDTADAVTGARYDLQRAQATLGATRRDALVTTATQYLEALRYSQEETADEAVVAVAQTALAATQAQLAVGAASSADVLDAQITLSEAQNDLAEVALSQDQALATLTQTLGVGVAAVAGEPPRATLPKSVEVTTATDAATLLAARSDLLSARLSVAEAELSAAQTRRSTLPSGSLSAAYGGSGVQLGSSIGTETYQPTLSLAYDPDGAADDGSGDGGGNGVTLQASVSIPLRSGSGATVAAAETNIVNAQQQLEQTQAQAQLELQAAQAQLSTAQNSLSSAQALVAQRQQSLTTSRQRLTLGLVPAYDVQNAEAELLGAQVDLARLRDSVLISQLTLLETLAQDPLEVF